MEIDLQELGEKLKDVLLHQERYQMDLVIKEYEGADFLFFYIYESHEDKAPTFYFITSPWDNKSNAAPQGAQVFENGELILQLDYTEYVKVRTGLMDAFALRALGHNLGGKKILYYGAGGTAEWSLKALKTYFPEVADVDYKNKSGGKASFQAMARELGVQTNYVENPDIDQYDYIFMHTSSREPVLSAADVSKIKEGAFISLYSDKKEADVSVYENATVLVNWPSSFEKEADLIEAKETGITNPEVATTMCQLLEGRSLEKGKHHVVFRSGGTPMQNIAMLQLLMSRK